MSSSGQNNIPPHGGIHFNVKTQKVLSGAGVWLVQNMAVQHGGLGSYDTTLIPNTLGRCVKHK